MTGRPRTSTLVLIGLFLAVFALWVLVRPVSAPAGTVQPTVSPASPASPAPTIASRWASGRRPRSQLRQA